MIHDPMWHHLLAPQDIPLHLETYHGARPLPTPEVVASAREYMEQRGIPSEGDDEIDVALAYHEYVHNEDERGEQVSMIGRKVRVESGGPGAQPWVGEIEEVFGGGTILRVRVTDAMQSWYRVGQRIDVGTLNCRAVD